MTILSRWSSRCGGEPPRIWYHVLLLALVGIFILDPLGGYLGVPQWLLSLGVTTILVLSILVVGRTAVQVGIALGLLLPAVVLSHFLMIFPPRYQDNFLGIVSI